MRTALIFLALAPVLFGAGTAVSPAPPPRITIRLDPVGGVLETGKTAHATLDLQFPSAPDSLHLSLRQNGGTELSQRELPLVSGQANLDATSTEPGAVLALLSGTDTAGQKFTAACGWIFSPEKIKPASPRPEDFDTFWDEQLAALALVPVDARLFAGKFTTPTPDSVDYTQFSLAVTATRRVHGQLARPKTPGKKFPAIVMFQWAGVYALDPATVTRLASRGWLAANISAHDLPIDEPAAYYDALSKGALKDYGTQGNDDRQKSYCLTMFLAVRRALDFVRAQPDWDGRVLVAQGTSQGGTQALIAAALDPAVTAVLANAPAYCDLSGPEAGRASPHPYWFTKTSGRDPEAVKRTARYFDVAHFAPRIHAPVLVSAGLIDQSCPPAGVAAMANALSGPHEIVFMPQAPHSGENNTHAPFKQRAQVWLDALREGRPAPVASR